MTDVISEVAGGVGRLRLNRPQALHALTLDMCTAMAGALDRWRDDPQIAAVLLDHAPAPDGDAKRSRGFCAGGDIRLLSESGAGDGVAARGFFLTEYRLNYQLFTYGKPVVAVMDGITMGGGVGIACPCRYRVATENTKLAMPETGIGLFPDVGGGWYLSRLPGRIGHYVALTGHRLDGAECVGLGLATHYVPSARLDTLKAALIARPEAVAAILAEQAVEPGAARILDHAAAIDRLFAADRLEDIFAALADDPSAFAQETLATLRTKSPLAMKVSLRLLHDGAAMPDFAAEMRQEYAVATRMVQQPDFLEGVRAVIVDKDQAPRWQADTPAAVDDEAVARIFAPLPADEAWTPG
ncbi:enoyl-CoA hydratase/isomerase family protein [Sphingomonas sp. RIT328]|uniref:enoyl-CoA hydratase/isomerase family protein n=1 Tax=Sphingomonas sp. RIT328 TaxID=1470591 RepID=UPI000447BBD5|nr:enoyl-CoA hydratase/isomerase family protein [Sphingomonas sp. RIT328]EZP48754.1 Enoyl-CoA hydratase/isomerase family protein [Sphingomonas sp. RIT328]